MAIPSTFYVVLAKNYILGNGLLKFEQGNKNTFLNMNIPNINILNGLLKHGNIFDK